MTLTLLGADLGGLPHVEGAGRVGVAATFAHTENAGTVNAICLRPHAEGTGAVNGDGTNAGANAHAEGAGNVTATVANAHAEGAATASGQNSHAEGTSTASGLNSHAEGAICTASGTGAHAEGGSCTASGLTGHAEGTATRATGNYSHAEGYETWAFRLAQHAKSGGCSFAVNGDAQYSNYVQGNTTTTATAALLTSDGGLVSDVGNVGVGANVLSLPAHTAFFFRAEVIARRTDVEGTVAAFTVMGAVSRESTGVPRLVGSPVTVSWADVAASTWTVVPSVVTIAGPLYYLAFTVTGEVSKTIRWVNTLHTTEVG